MLDKYLENKEYELALEEVALELMTMKEELLKTFNISEEKRNEKIINVIAQLNEINFSIRIKGNINKIIEEK